MDKWKVGARTSYPRSPRCAARFRPSSMINRQPKQDVVMGNSRHRRWQTFITFTLLGADGRVRELNDRDLPPSVRE
jgi:hypothetical protein